MIQKAQQVTQITPALFRSNMGYTFNPDDRSSKFVHEQSGRSFSCRSDVLIDIEANMTNNRQRVLKIYLLWPPYPTWDNGTPLSKDEIVILRDFAERTGPLAGFEIVNDRE